MADQCCIIDLGSFPHNEDLETGLSASQFGDHKVQLFFSGARLTQVIPLTYYQEIIIPRPFNEDYLYKMQIIQPDGTLYTQDDCDTFSFKIYLNINSPCGTDCDD